MQINTRTDFDGPSALSIVANSVINQPIQRSGEPPEGWDAWLDAIKVYGGQSKSGQRVTHHAAMMMPAFWQGCDMKSGDVAKIALEIYTRGAGRARTLNTSHPCYNVARHQANPDQSAFDWRRQMMLHRIVWNNAYSYIDRNGRGDVTGLYPLLPDRTRCRRIDGRLIYESEIGGQLRYFNAFDIWHIHGISFNGETGLELVKYARDEIGKILARTDFASRFFKMGGRIGGVLQLEPTRSKTKLDRQESGFRKSYEGGDAAFKTVILRDNAKFLQAQASFKDTQMNEVGQEDVRTVARLLNMPPHKLGAQGSTSYGSLEQENQAYYDNSLSHHFCEIESEFWLKCLPKQTRRAGRVYFEHTIGALLWADSKTVAEVANSAVLAGWLLRNEARGWFNLNPMEGGDKPLIPSGMMEGGESDSDDQSGDQTDGRSKELAAAIDELLQETEARFIKRMATHARKAAKDPATVATWIQGAGLNGHLEHGRRMFATITKTQKAATGQEPPDYAEELLTTFRGQLDAAIRSDSLNEILEEFLS